MTARSRQVLASLVAISFALGPGCSRKSDDAGSSEQQELPPLSFNDDTPELMLTWIDERGDTHVEQSTKLVPKEQSRFVRVVIAERDQRDPIYVADLTEPDASGSYSARSVPRSRWEDEIAKRRKESGGQAAAPTPPRSRPRPAPRERPAPAERGEPSPLPAPPPNHDKDKPDPPLDPSMASVKVIVYGTSWCQACHKALEHVKRKGVKAELRDIEKDKGAAVEMKTKLGRASLADRGTIPVIDVSGTILVGYSPPALDRALDKARGGTML